MANIQSTPKTSKTNKNTDPEYEAGFATGLRAAELIEALEAYNNDAQSDAAYAFANTLRSAHKYTTTSEFIAAALEEFTELQRG